MKLHLTKNDYIETDDAIDISIPVNFEKGITAWYLGKSKSEIVRSDNFVGAIAEGGAVNFRDIYFNPHAHCTHTECCGHITSKVHSINQQHKSIVCQAILCTIEPTEITVNGSSDLVITLNHFSHIEDHIKGHDALIIRTSPNSEKKLSKEYSGTNPVYFDIDVLEFLNKHKVKHLIIDLPSVDKEQDGGLLSFHHKFWDIPNDPIMDRTITELAYVPNSVDDGSYLLNLQIAPFENDASPSRPILYKIRRAV